MSPGYSFTQMEIEKKIGQRIKELRLVRQHSQEKLAGLAEIDRTYMTSVENGKRNISVRNMEKILNALEVSWGDFFNSSIFNSK